MIAESKAFSPPEKKTNSVALLFMHKPFHSVFPVLIVYSDIYIQIGSNSEIAQIIMLQKRKLKPKKIKWFDCGNISRL